MKIGIITQPLRINYGGLLQNYALQQVLLKQGHDVYTIDRTYLNDIYRLETHRYIKYLIKETINKFLIKKYSPTKNELRKITENCRRFVEENIIVTNYVKRKKDFLATTAKYSFDAFVVGSDQVWRPMYSPNILNDFLDFCQEQPNIKRIAYAASFGVDDWEYTPIQTTECSRLAKMFNAISVRECSGIELCKKHLGVEATLVLDPTLLLEKEDYIKLISKSGEQESEGNLFCYILDDNDTIKNSIHYIEKKLSLKGFQVKSAKKPYIIERGDNLTEHVIPSPTKWLRAFMDAKIVFTDSFHGCVFSIIFNKPFWVIGNKERGNARFDSLLKLFNLEDRLVSLDKIESTNLLAPIYWEKVNTTKKEWQNKSLAFIKENLKTV